MLCNNAAVSNLGHGFLGMPASGRHSHTRDTEEKDQFVVPYLLQVLARFLLSVLRG